MVMLRPATSLNRIGLMRRHIALSTTGRAHFGEVRISADTGKQERAPDRVRAA